MTKASGASAPAVVAGVKVTNAGRVVYRIGDREVTKGDVARYVEKVAPLMLPHVRGRPLTIVRCRLGSAGPGFFQKHVMKGMPAAIDAVDVVEKKGTARCLAVHDAAGLVGLVQMSALEFHVWSSAPGDQDTPDRVIVDLDPDAGLPWARVVEAAQRARALFAADSLESFVKTTGGKGLHVIAPLDVSDARRAPSWDDVAAYGARLAEAMSQQAPDDYTTNMSKAVRTGKIFLDVMRNGRGATTIAPWSTRKNGGTISVPVSWAELPDIRGSTWTLLDVDDRLRSLGGAGGARDPWRRFFEVRQRLPS